MMMQVYLNPTPQGFWDRDTLPGLSTYIDHSLTHSLLITVSDWHRSQLHSSDDAGVSEPHPSRFLGQRHSPGAVYLHRSLTHSYIQVMMQVYLNPTPQGFWDRDTHPGVSEPHPSRFLGQRHSPRTVYLHRSLTHSLSSSYNCFRLAQITATYQ